MCANPFFTFLNNKLYVTLGVATLGVTLSGMSLAWADIPPEPKPPRSELQLRSVEPKVTPTAKPSSTTSSTVKSVSANTSASTSAPISLGTQTDVLNMTDDLGLAKAQVDAYPDNPEAHFLYAVALSRSPYLEKAFGEVKTVKELLKQKQDFSMIDQTIDQYAALAQDNPTNDVVLYRLAFANYFKGYLVEKYPHHMVNVPHDTAQVYYTTAKTYMNKVIELKPNDISARNYLGHVILENDKDVNQAISVWKASLAVNESENPAALLMLARAYSMQGDIQKALIYGAKGLQQKQAMGLQF